MIGDITPLEEAKPKLPSHLRIKVALETVSSSGTIDELQTLCSERKGAATRALRSGAQRRLHRGDGSGRL